jgi:hypothetical protein
VYIFNSSEKMFPLFLSIVNVLATPVFGARRGGGTNNETRHLSALNFSSIAVIVFKKLNVQ